MIEELDFAYGTMDDLEDIYKIVDITGWGETLDDIRQIIANIDNKYILLISPKSEIVGVTLAVNNGGIGFIGHVIVLPEYRGMGLGEQLMIEAINYLKFRGCKTIKLDAVHQAISLYERVGFQFELKSLRYKLDLSNDEKINEFTNKVRKSKHKNPVKNSKVSDFEEIIKIDNKLFECNRENYLQALFDEFPEYTFIVKDSEKKILGYSFGLVRHETLYIRAGYCKSKEIAIDLILSAIERAKSITKIVTVSLGIPEYSSLGLQALEDLGFDQTGFSTRMFWGAKSTTGNSEQFFAIGHPAKG
ncbi:MAG: GNAT family N-acetyltransferase [Candidatus Thorarchaeota archaeon]